MRGRRFWTVLGGYGLASLDIPVFTMNLSNINNLGQPPWAGRSGLIVSCSSVARDPAPLVLARGSEMGGARTGTGTGTPMGGVGSSGTGTPLLNCRGAGPRLSAGSMDLLVEIDLWIC